MALVKDAKPILTPSAKPRFKRKTFADKERGLAGVMLGPALAFVLVLAGIPFVLAILLSFSSAKSGSLSYNWVGLQNFAAIVTDPLFVRALVNTVVITVVSQIAVIVLASTTALILDSGIRGRPVFRFLLMLPWAVPVSLGALAWVWIFDSTFSVLNWALLVSGLLKHWLYWLGQTDLALAAIIIVNVWRMFPFATVIVLAALTSVPPDIKEAALVDGAGFWRRIFAIEFPLLLPVYSVAILFGITFTSTDLSIVYLLTNGGPYNSTHVLATLAFQRGILGGDLGQGAAIASFLLPFLAIVVIIMLQLTRRAEDL